MLETSIHVSDFRQELNKLTQRPTIKCPRCQLATTYKPDEFFLS